MVGVIMKEIRNGLKSACLNKVVSALHTCVPHLKLDLLTVNLYCSHLKVNS